MNIGLAVAAWLLAQTIVITGFIAACSTGTGCCGQQRCGNSWGGD